MIRLCLKCNTEFDSSGPGNRLCQKCNFNNQKVLIHKSHPSPRFMDKQLDDPRPQLRRNQNRGDE